MLWVLDLSDTELPAITQSVLDRLNVASIPRIFVFNKLDRCTTPPSDEELGRLADGHPHLALSAHDGSAVAQLRETISSSVRARDWVREVFVPLSAPS